MFINGKKRIPIGYEDFREVIDKDFYYIDKTMLIHDILTGGGKNNLITRPRRFGKTLNLSMLRYFFDIRERDNFGLFDGLAISKYYNEVAEYRNTHPVIMLSLKGAKQNDFETALKSICAEIKEKFSDYSFIVEGGRINEVEREGFRRIMSTDADAALFGSSVKLLSRCLKQYYGKNAIILIDEYDVPLESAYFGGYYDEMVGFIRSLFESALKTNDALEFSVITGCLRISKESIFTGLNNLKTNTILNKRYSEYFGFNETEVKGLLDYYGMEKKFGTIKRWYDGYLFGDKEIYNPWSIMYYAGELLEDEEADPKANWINTSSNNIIRSLIENSTDETRSAVERLVNGGSIKTHLSETVTYEDMQKADENIWSFLFFTGYLRIQDTIPVNKETGEEAVYTLVIPNIEIRTCYIKLIMNYFDSRKRSMDKEGLLEALLSGDAEGFARPVTSLLKSTVSYYDNAENFYHGLLVGLLSGNVYYRVESNRENGSGRSDIVIYQLDRAENAIIIEIKICDKNEMPDKAASRALEQINEKHYDDEARERGYRRIQKYGVAFKDKICVVLHGE